ncbi:ribose transport system substrate-binding protein [Paraburkholderia sacchari]|uniref:substrate-binding domain-containing protein n=1 Tax=Paraburkholderia sacchari TaxID=159450 RepID=UPI0039A60262
MMKRTVAFCGVLSLTMSVATTHAAELKKVGIAVNNIGDPYYVALARGAEQKLKTIAPAASVTTVSSGYDITKQINQIENFISAGVSMIIVTPSDYQALAPELARAKAQGIAVVGADTGSNGLVAGVQTDNVAAGQMACAELARRLGDKGNVVVVKGAPISVITDRVNGCLGELKKHPGIKVLSSDQSGGGTRDGGLSVMQNLLSRFGNIDGAFVVAEEMAIGARIATVQAGHNRILITTVDGSPAIQQEMKGNDGQIVATAAQNPRGIGEQAAEIGVALAAGKSISDPFRKLPPKLVTKEAISNYSGW